MRISISYDTIISHDTNENRYNRSLKWSKMIMNNNRKPIDCKLIVNNDCDVLFTNRNFKPFTMNNISGMNIERDMDTKQQNNT
jgi:hypothetical protein